MKGELIPNERFKTKQLEEYENQIEDATRNAYMVVGACLAEIRDKELYKVQRTMPVMGKYSFSTWDEYLQERWGWTRPRAHQLIAAYEVGSKMLTKVNVLPPKETHLREILKLESDKDRVNVWKQVVDSGQKVTAKLITDEVGKYIAAKNKDWITLDEWNAIPEARRMDAMQAPDMKKTFNKQDNANIEWAQWSWNPITGCKHDCPYCYARDIAERFYVQKFAPALYPGRLHVPMNSEVPAKAKDDTRYRNVFTCSMSDMFGRWVPAEWIDAVLDVIHENPQWNFLTLTKFPNRIQEFEIPSNAWMGTTVDMQVRVANAEKAFSKFECGVKWLSVEPMLEPLKFSRLDLFDWVVIGGASKSNKTPAWHPPYEWIYDLYSQCRDAGVKVYFKSNLFSEKTPRVLELPFDSIIEGDDKTLPDAFNYLGKS